MTPDGQAQRGRRATMSGERHSTGSSLLRRVETVFDGRALSRAMFALVPLLVLALVSGKSEWLAAAIVPVAMLIALDHSQLAPLGVFAHALAISAGFVILMASLAHPLLFVVATVLLGMGSVLVTAGGSALRSLGNFTFIPSLYLACESAEGVTRQALITRSVEVLPFLLIAALPILLLASVEHFRSRETGRPTLAHFAKWTRLFPNSESNAYIELMITVALAIACAAVLVEWRHVDHGQWMIWSAASVVTGNAVSARQKFRNRLTGAVVGVSFGVAVGLMIPHASFMRVLVVFTAMLTLICIRPYTLAFGVRCACAAIAFVLAGKPWIFGGERLLNVAVGSAIGLLCALTASAIAAHMKDTCRSTCDSPRSRQD
jgi:Fusaric acid resistance protein-like